MRHSTSTVRVIVHGLREQLDRLRLDARELSPSDAGLFEVVLQRLEGEVRELERTLIEATARSDTAPEPAAASAKNI